MSYWQDRYSKSQNKLTRKNIKKVEAQMRKYYISSMKRTIADFEDVYTKLVNTMAEGIAPTPADLYKLDSYWKMQGQLKKELQILGSRQVKALASAFEANFFDVYYSIALPSTKEFTTVDKEIVKQLINHIWVADGKMWSQRIWDNTSKLASTLNEALINCVVNGKEVGHLRDALLERFNVSYSQADSLARTELAHIQTQAAKKRYEDYGIQEVEVWADEDERRCKVCGKLHQKRYPIGAEPPIPAHPRCRCCIVPVVE